jgi:hypothetical protein
MELIIENCFNCPFRKIYDGRIFTDICKLGKEELGVFGTFIDKSIHEKCPLKNEAINNIMTLTVKIT